VAGQKRRWKIRFEDGTIRTVTAQGFTSAKRTFIAQYQPPKGSQLVIWPMGEEHEKRHMRV
jgi:hypothetical protein